MIYLILQIVVFIVCIVVISIHLRKLRLIKEQAIADIGEQKCKVIDYLRGYRSSFYVEMTAIAGKIFDDDLKDMKGSLRRNTSRIDFINDMMNSNSKYLETIEKDIQKHFRNLLLKSLNGKEVLAALEKLENDKRM